ncbi:MAG TPA: hypothetical protein VK684_00355 [Edaphobacter sp.]|jgi:hypothetical protein|nr:hypothetical protein [Edaphobacter sp.]
MRQWFAMRTFRFLRFSPAAFALMLVVTFCIKTPHLKAQQVSSSQISEDRLNRDVYRVLFRQAALYQKLADEAEVSDKPKPYLRHILAARFQLSDDDNTTLNRLSISYQKEIDPIQKQVVELVQRFRARFPSGIIGPGMDTTPPSELAVLERQEDAVTFRYRDLLRNSMREDAFQKFHAKILEQFGKRLK